MSLQLVHVVALFMLLSIASVIVEARNRDHWVQLKNQWRRPVTIRSSTGSPCKFIALSYVMQRPVGPLIVPRITHYEWSFWMVDRCRLNWWRLGGAGRRYVTAKPLIYIYSWFLMKPWQTFGSLKINIFLTFPRTGSAVDGFIFVTAIDGAGPIIMKCSFNNPSKRSTIL